MMRLIRISIVLVAIAAAVGLIVRQIERMYVQPRALLLAQIETVSNRLETYKQAEQDHQRVEEEIQRVVNRTLGGDLETVDHRLRSRLNRLAEQSGVSNVTVGSGEAAARQTPAAKKFSPSTHRELREEIDFVELQAWIRASGSLAQTLGLVDRIASEPWLRHLDQFKLQTRENGTVFEVTIRVTTVFLPGGSPQSPEQLAADATDIKRYRELVEINPFRLPPTQAIAEAQEESQESGASFPYDEWAVTGVAKSAAGSEIWLLNEHTRESRRLMVGERLEEVILLAAHGETAEFLIGTERFIVEVGHRLNERQPVR